MDTFPCGRARREPSEWVYRDSAGYKRCRCCTRKSNRDSMRRARQRWLSVDAA